MILGMIRLPNYLRVRSAPAPARSGAPGALAPGARGRPLRPPGRARASCCFLASWPRPQLRHSSDDAAAPRPPTGPLSERACHAPADHHSQAGLDEATSKLRSYVDCFKGDPATTENRMIILTGGA